MNGALVSQLFSWTIFFMILFRSRPLSNSGSFTKARESSLAIQIEEGRHFIREFEETRLEFLP